jgi:dihydrofolate synthase / folylpolyglutamate synthase
MTYEESIAYLYARLPMFQRVGAPALKYDLSNTYKLLESVGNPHQNIKCIHIAGTNGKGSSAHAIAAILTESGYKTGLFTSPHLKSFTERGKIDGVEMPREFVVDFVSKIKGQIEYINPSFFEVTFVMAICFFYENQVDIAVIETGLGGRLDSTNVIDPIACLITMIGWDHSDLLGDTLEKIASEKAGIIKKGVPVVIGADQPELLHVFAEKAKIESSELILASNFEAEMIAERSDCVIVKVLEGGQVRFDTLVLDMTASYFRKNLPGVLSMIALLKQQGWDISDQNIQAGLEHAKEKSGLKGRWQVLRTNPKIVADISHNLPGLEAFFDQVEKEPKKHLHIIFGVVKDKSIDSILKFLQGIDASFYFTQSSVPRSLSAVDLQTKAEAFGLSGLVFADVNAAMDAAKSDAVAEDLIVVCGSTFVVAEILEL